MKATCVAILMALISLTSAQSGIQDLPVCAQGCVNEFTAGSNIGGCSSSDIKCICSSPTFLSGIACCLVGKCNAADQAAATKFAHDFCSISGVTNLPDSVTCASNSTSTTTAPTSTASSTSTSTPSATPNSGFQNVARVGAGVFGVAMVALL